LFPVEIDENIPSEDTQKKKKQMAGMDVRSVIKSQSQISDKTLSTNLSSNDCATRSESNYFSDDSIEIGEMVLGNNQLKSMIINTIYELNDYNLLLGK
jgi:hypothetical protein